MATEIGSDGIVWIGEFLSGKMARFDPKTQTFKEYQLPGPDPTPYGMGIDAFIARADQLAQRHGDGFALSEDVKQAIRKHEPRW